MVASLTGIHMELETLRAEWVKGSPTNFTSDFSATYGQSAVVQPDPGSDAKLIDLNQDGAKTCNALLLKFWGAGANNNTMNARIWGISRCITRATGKSSWEFTLLCQLAITFGNLAGVSGGMIVSSDFEADTYVVTYGAENVSVYQVSTTDVRGAYVAVDTMGNGMIAVEGDRNSSATNWNFGWKKQ